MIVIEDMIVNTGRERKEGRREYASIGKYLKARDTWQSS